jgi:hypothetical protein
MTARKPKPKPRKASGPTLEQRVNDICAAIDELIANDANALARECAREKALREIRERMTALESRDRLRDKSHDEPVSNAGEAVGQHFRIVGEVKPRWKFWRRG